MKIVITTDVEQDYRTVWSKFDEQLFTALKPPLMPLQLLRFDGSLKGDEVHLKVAGQLWIAEIIEQAELTDEIYFVDKGKKLPFPLKYWKHRHRILRKENGSQVIDDIEFRTPNRIIDFLFYPILYAQFAARSPIYKRYFKH
ncbi:MAG: hypothetical protein AAGG68_31005 [Bacteroidota bacterium]